MKFIQFIRIPKREAVAAVSRYNVDGLLTGSRERGGEREREKRGDSG
jgi:hypothetical protein